MSSHKTSDKKQSAQAQTLLLTGLTFGIIADLTLRETPWGLNATILVVPFVIAWMIFRRRFATLAIRDVSLGVAIIVLSCFFGWRASEQLLVLNAAGILTIFAALGLSAVNIDAARAGVSHYIFGYLYSALSAAFGSTVLFLRDVKADSDESSPKGASAIQVLKGILIGIPLVVVFAALFASADASFESALNRVSNLPGIDKLVSHVLFITFFAWIGVGYLRGSIANLFQSQSDVGEENYDSPISAIRTSLHAAAKRFDPMEIGNTILPRTLTLGAVETGIALGLVNALFLVFVLLQIPYLFGGFEFVRNAPDLILSEYARRGFGELVAVAAITLPVLLASHWLLRRDTPTAERTFRIFAGIQIALLFVIMASALQRLMLLTGSLGYGWTTTRFYPMVFMSWLAVVFVLFVATVLRGNRNRFAWAALWSAFVFVGALNFFNPDKFIVESNIRLMNQGREFDAVYNSRLSDDAVPSLLSALPSMTFEWQCIVKERLSKHLEQRLGETNALTFNLSRKDALDAWQVNREALNYEECPRNPLR